MRKKWLALGCLLIIVLLGIWAYNVQRLVRNHQDCFREFPDDYDGRYCEGE